jgi:hypothetical protein
MSNDERPTDSEPPQIISAATVRATAQLLREAASEADCCVTTVLKVAAGDHVRGRVGTRAERVLARRLAR